MPRPLSMTLIELSVWIVTVISSQKPASASSTALSTTSNTMWCRPVPSEVSPMYMPGRLRTASRPFRTLMASEPYSFGFAAKSDSHRHHDVLEALLARIADQRAGGRIAKRAFQLAARHIVQHVQQVIDIEADIERIPRVMHFELLLCFFLVGIGGDDLQAAIREHPADTPEYLVRQDCRPLQRLPQRLALDLQAVLVLRRYDARVVRELSIDQLGDQLDRAEAERRLSAGQFNAHFIIAIGKQLRQLNYGLTRDDRLLTWQARPKRQRSKGEAVSIGGHHLEFAALHHHQQPVQVVADVLLRHRVLHEPQQMPQRLLRQRKARYLSGGLGKARKILCRKGLQAEPAAARFDHQALVLRLQADFGVLGEGTQNIEQLPCAYGQRACVAGTSQGAARTDLNLDIGGKETERFGGAVDQYVREDWQSVASFDDAAHRSKRRQQLVSLCFDHLLFTYL